jgi:hypothetical protein
MDFTDTSGDEGVRARRGPALVGARLQRDDDGGLLAAACGGGECDGRSVRSPNDRGGTFADDRSVTEDDASDGGVRSADPCRGPAQFDRTLVDVL